MSSPPADILNSSPARCVGLPAPAGEFIPMLRMYWPKDKAPSILDGSWTPPKVQKVQ